MNATRKLVVITRKTQVEELVLRFNTRSQAKFYIEANVGKGRFQRYQAEHDEYHRGVDALEDLLPKGVPTQFLERAMLPTYTFGPDDIVIAVGPDGLVVNVAKYLDGQPLIAVNPDPGRIDGVLLPFATKDARSAIDRALNDQGQFAAITMAEASLNDGQTLLAVNDLFIGQKTHTSARYRLNYNGGEENQSSSGIIVSTGAGSTGWLQSIVGGAYAVARHHGAIGSSHEPPDPRFDWQSRQLVFNVREPFVSKTSSADTVSGTIDATKPLVVTSQMPQNGVIFSDGVEEDYLAFNSGAIARVGLSGRTLRLMLPG